MSRMAWEDFFCGRRVVVTGGAGFIGSHVVELLVGAGALVRVPVRATTDLTSLAAVRERIEVARADLFSRASAEESLIGQEIVLHLAAAKGGGISHSMKHHGSLFRDNMSTSLNVLEAARKTKPSRLLCVSSACVYPRRSTIPIPEEEGFLDEPEPTNSGYGWSKRMQEYLAFAFAEEFGLDIGVVRPFNAYGPRDDFFREANHVIPGLITRVCAGEDPLVVWGTGQQTRSFLYVDDCARGILMAAAHPGLKGPLNLGGDEETSIAELARIIVEESGCRADLRFDATKPDGQPRRACDTRKAKEMLGFVTRVPLREGIRRAIDWYRNAKEAQEVSG